MSIRYPVVNGDNKYENSATKYIIILKAIFLQLNDCFKFSCQVTHVSNEQDETKCYQTTRKKNQLKQFIAATTMPLKIKPLIVILLC